MEKYIIAIDQSTSATKAILFDNMGKLVGKNSFPHKQIYPRQGWVEHNPIEIYDNTVLAIKEIVKKTGINKKSVIAIAITNQRETTLLWEQDGTPVHNAIVWKCSRATEITNQNSISLQADYIKEATGIYLSPYFSAAKAKWICNNTDIKEGTLFGTMDSWLVWKLTGNHATDYSNASRTQLFNIHSNKWDEKIIDIFDLNELNFPEVKSSNEIFGYTTVEGFFDKEIPVSGVMGDSHAALFAQKCFEIGTGKATFGTGTSVMINIGNQPKKSENGLVTSIAWALDGQVEYVFEGNINSSGDTMKWLAEEMDLMDDVRESGEIALSIGSTNGVYLVPAFHGLGAPHWDNNCTGLICGIKRDTNKNHIIRAGAESIAYQICDITNAAAEDMGKSIDILKVDGGATKDTFLMQFVSDVLRAKLIKSEIEEYSALGSMYMAGLAFGLWKDKQEIERIKTKNDEFEPKMDIEKAKKLYLGWQKALVKTMGDNKKKVRSNE